jgi:hypothetical protein
MNKKASRLLIAGLVLILTCYVITEVKAGPLDTVAVKVTVTPSISVSITEGTLILGAVAAGGTKVSATAVTVTNDGSGVNETYSLSLANPAGWIAAQDAPGVEVYVLNAALSNVVPDTWDVAKHALSTSPVVCSATKFAGDQTGVGVPYNATRKLWFQFKAPTATTVGIEQDIVVTVTAQVS